MKDKNDILGCELNKRFHSHKNYNLNKESINNLLIKNNAQKNKEKQKIQFKKEKKYSKNKIKLEEKYKSKITFQKIIFSLYFLNIILMLSFLFSFSKENKLGKIISSSEITITIKGAGEQEILSSVSFQKDDKDFSFNYIPDEIYINGAPQSYNGKTVNGLSGETNNITMKWNENLVDCNLIFHSLNNIIFDVKYVSRL